MGRGVCQGETTRDKVTFKITDVLLLPSMNLNIFSVKKVCQFAYKVEFTRDHCTISHHSGEEMIRAMTRLGLYQLELENTSHREGVLAIRDVKNPALKLWHNRLGHLNEETIQKMFPAKNFESGKLTCFLVGIGISLRSLMIFQAFALCIC